MSNIVTAPLVLATDNSGHLRYLYQLSAVPEDIPAKEVARLTELGLIGDPDHPLAIAANPGAIGIDASATESGLVEMQGTDPASVRLPDRTVDEKPPDRRVTRRN